MNDKTSYLTPAGMEQLQAELDNLVRVRRKEIATRIQEAKELGDLSENAEYQEAKTEQSFNEGRIEELENILKHAEIITEQTGRHEAVQVGSSLTVDADGKSMDLRIVGSSEADPLQGWISNESPLGKALLGRRTGDEAMVETPKGQLKYVVKKIG